jgi:hypothetical protein
MPIDSAVRRAHPGDVVPADLVERLRQLLHPAVVGEAPVVDRRIGVERDLEAAGGRGLLGRGRGDRRGGDRHRLRRERRARLVFQKPCTNSSGVFDSPASAPTISCAERPS